MHNDNPPVELFSQHFSEKTYRSESKMPVELLKLDIEISSLFGAGDNSEEDIAYVAKFLSNFCRDSIDTQRCPEMGKKK